MPIKGLLSLFFTLPNFLFSVKLFKSQTRFALGEALFILGLKKIGRRVMEKAIRIAGLKGYVPVMEEQRMLLATYIMENDPEYAEYLLVNAKKYFDSKGFYYYSERCVKCITEASKYRNEMFPELSDRRTISQSFAVMRNILEASTLLELFTKLSVISDFKTLLRTAIDTACHISGADHGIILIKENEKWIPKNAKNVEITDESLKGLGGQIDLPFLEKAFSQELGHILVRRTSGSARINNKSTMLLPLRYMTETSGIIYLGSHSISGLFDEHSENVLSHVGTQIAVSIQNFFLLERTKNLVKETQNLVEELKIKGNEISGLNMQLQQHIVHLDQLVDEKTRNIRLLLNSIKQGILTIGNMGHIGPDFSPYVNEILDEKAVAGQDAIEYIFKNSYLSADEKNRIYSAMCFALGSDEMNFKVNESQLINEFKIKGPGGNGEDKIIEIDWAPVVNNEEIVESVLVVLRDVTQIRKYKEVFQKREEEISVISELLNIQKPHFISFMNSAVKYIGENREIIGDSSEWNEAAIRKIFLNYHTLKALARSIGLIKLASSIHESEHKYKVLLDAKAPWDQAELLDDLEKIELIRKNIVTISNEKLGWSRQEMEMSGGFPYDKMKKILSELRSIDISHLTGREVESIESSCSTLELGMFRNIRDIIRDILDSAESLAAELGKLPPVINIEDNDYQLSADLHEAIKNMFVHLIRNSLDHGIENHIERRQAGKNDMGTISVQFDQKGSMLQMKYSDDGRGLNLAKLRHLGIEKGMVNSDTGSIREICDLIFSEGVSTKSDVTQISGCGMGMGAVRSYLKEKDCTIEVVPRDNGASLDFIPFEFHVLIPEGQFRRFLKKVAA
ncbi:MAG: hypothetical protein HQK54_14160 [Oligoflexales bacterium]|nr:hypothetical protein [Oligoflexales bacterium]